MGPPEASVLCLLRPFLPVSEGATVLRGIFLSFQALFRRLLRRIFKC